MSKMLASIVLGSLIFAATTAGAKEGFYLGAGFIHNKMLNTDLNYLDPAVGLDFKAGYNLGPFSVEANLLGSSHGDTRTGFGEADFGGLSIDFRIPFTPKDWINQIYVLFGLSGYSLTVDDPVAGEVKYSGGGENLLLHDHAPYWGWRMDSDSSTVLRAVANFHLSRIAFTL